MFRPDCARPGILVLLATLAILVVFSARLSATRIYQVDECYSIANARIISQGRQADFATAPGAFIVALSSLTHGPARARDLFARDRASGSTVRR